MEVINLGGGSVKLTGKNLSVICDPADSGKADVYLLSDEDQEVKAGGAMVIDGPGEYEVKGAMVTGVSAQRHTDTPEEPQKATMYSADIDGVNVAFLGNVAPGLSDTQVEALGQVDVLIVPVGGHGLTLDTTGAAQMVSRLEPKYVVPVHYDDGTKYAMPQDGVDVFLKEMGASPEPLPKLKIVGKDMPLETEVVVLEKA